MTQAKRSNNLSEENKKSPLRRVITIGVKIIFTIAAIYLITTKADLREIGNYLKQMSPAYVVMALLTLNVGQVTSAFRLRYYFSTEKIYFRRTYSVALYYIGMFFNRLLPGGIGGDAYIAYILKKRKNMRVRTSVRMLLSTRASGLLQLMVFVFLLGFMSSMREDVKHWDMLMVMGALITILSYTMLTRLILREKVATQIGALKYSLVVQGAVVVASASLFLSTGHAYMLADYLMLFMISSVMTMIPISFGGAGMRELTYFYGAAMLGLDPELGIAVSVVYFLLDTISSLAGLFFWHRIDKIPAFKKQLN